MSRRGNALAKLTTFGRKGGAGPTTGLVSSTYRIRFPDGTSVQKRAFRAIQPEAIAYIYEHGGKWYCAGVYDTPADKMRGYLTAPAERVL